MAERDFSLLHIVLILIRKKYFFLINFCIAFALAIGLSLLLAKTYKSTVTFIPPGQSSSGLLSILGNNMSPDFLMGSDLSKRQYVALLHSRELREKLIQKFNLIQVYKLDKMIPKLDLTLKALDKNIIIQEKEEGGLGITDIISVAVSVIDEKPQRAADMANELFRLLEEKAIQIGQREINLKVDFLKKQIQTDEIHLVAARKALYEFQKNNKIYDISLQGKLSVTAISKLEAEKTALEMQKLFLQQSFSSQNNEMDFINNKLAAYSSKINDFEKHNKNTITPGLLKTLELSNEYADLMKEAETYFQLTILLRQQLELAKIKQQKSYSSICLVDAARPAEWKYKPKRAIFVIGITMVYMVLLLWWVLLKEYYFFLKTTNPEKVNSLLKAIKEK